jgi:16S rRNA (cytosine1402-N4)-methyltransferase
VDETEHVPVLLAEVLRALNLHADGTYVDATYGRGGHAKAILALLGPGGRLIALDRDPDAVADARRRFSQDARFEIHRGPFSMLAEVIGQQGRAQQVQGVLFDLGVSSPQLDAGARGFSFTREGPLDMRMDPASGESAADWINRASAEEIADVLFQLGEERFGRRIARAIVSSRSAQRIETTAALREIVARAVPTRERGKDPATRSFQAIRIHINRELDELAAALPQAVDALAPGGRLVVISFHSLEDRIVKRFMRRESSVEMPPRGLPLPANTPQPRLRIVGKAIKPEEAETRANPRARSAVLRVAERVTGATHG